jgi:hypothetical protein
MNYMERFKRTIAWIGLVGILLSSSMIAQAASFTDVSEDDWYYGFVTDLVDAEVIEDGDLFRPGDPLNRAEMAKIAVKAAGLELDSSEGPTFDDVAEDAWFYDYVETAAMYAVVEGDKDAEGNLVGTFRPGDPVNRAEAAKILVNAMALVENVEGGPHFSDVAEDAWYYNYVETAYNWSVVDGNPDTGLYAPGDPVTRAAVAKIAINSMSPVEREVGGEEEEEEEEGEEGEEEEEEEEEETPVVETSDSSLTVTLGATSPATAVVPQLAQGVVYTSLDLTAVGEEDIEVTGLVLMRSGLGHRDDFTAINVYNGVTKVTTSKTLNSDGTATFSFNPDVTVEAGETVTLDVRVDIASVTATNVAAGNLDALGLLTAEAVSSNAAEVVGTFPVMGNQMSIGSVSVGSLASSASTVSDITLKVGELQQVVGQFQMSTSGSSEDVTITSIKLQNKGAADANDLGNFNLYQGTELLASVESTDSDYVNFVFETPYELEKSKSKIFKVKADILGGVGSGALIYVIDETNDVMTEGATYGYGVAVTNTYTSGTSTSLTIEAGELTVELDGPASFEVTSDSDDVVLANVVFTTGGEDVNVKKMYAYITGTDSVAGTELDDGMENVQLVNTVTGDTLDAVSNDDAAGDDDSYYFYFQNFELSGASTWELVVDLNESYIASGDTLVFNMFAGADAVDADAANNMTTDVKGLEVENLADQDAVNDINPGAAIEGNTVTVENAGVTLAAVTLADGHAVAKSKDVIVGKITIEASSADDVKLTTLNYEVVGVSCPAAVCDNQSSNYTLFQVVDDGDDLELQSGVSSSSNKVQFADMKDGEGLDIAAGEQVILYATTDIASSVSATSLKLNLSAITDTPAGIVGEDSDGDTILAAQVTGLAADLTGRMATLHSAGTITFTVDNSSPDSAHYAASDSAGHTALVLKANAAYEDVVLKTLNLRNIGAVLSTEDQAFHVTAIDINGAPADGDTVTINGRTYEVDTFAANDGVVAGNIEVAVLVADSAANAKTAFILAITNDTSAQVTATSGAGNDVTLTAITYGAKGNYTLSTTGGGNIAVNNLAAGIGYGVPDAATDMVRGTATLTINSAVTDGDTVTVGTQVYEFDTFAASDGITTVGGIEVQLTADTVGNAAAQLAAAINTYSTVASATATTTTVVATAQQYGTAAAVAVPTTDALTDAVSAFDFAVLTGGSAGTAATDDNIAKVYMYVDGELVKTVTTLSTTGYAEFKELDSVGDEGVVISKDTDSVIEFVVDMAGIGDGATDTADSGDSVKLVLEGHATTFMEARGYSSNADLTATSMVAGSALAGQFTSVYGSTVTAALASGIQPDTLSNDAVEALKFTLTPSTNNNKTTLLTGLDLNVNFTDASGSTLGIVDSGATYAIEVYSGATRVAYYSVTAGDTDTSSGMKTLTVTEDEMNSAGETYVVKLNIVGSGADDKVATSLKVNQGAGSDYVEWKDYSDGSTVAWIDLGENSTTTAVSNTIES